MDISLFYDFKPQLLTVCHKAEQWKYLNPLPNNVFNFEY